MLLLRKVDNKVVSSKYSHAYLFRGICHKYSLAPYRTAHFPASPSERREELAVDQRGLVAVHARGNVTRHPEISVLHNKDTMVLDIARYRYYFLAKICPFANIFHLMNLHSGRWHKAHQPNGNPQHPGA